MGRLALALIAIGIFFTCASADDIADVTAAEIAFNEAENAGNIEDIYKHLLPERTVWPPTGVALIKGWNEDSKKRRQARYDAGLKINLEIRDLDVKVYGGSAITTFYRFGTEQEPGNPPVEKRYRISGVWIREDGKWKLAHRHESPLETR